MLDQSALGIIMLYMHELIIIEACVHECSMQDLAKSDGIRVNCICPGMVNTAMVKGMFSEQSPLTKDVQEYVKATMLR